LSFRRRSEEARYEHFRRVENSLDMLCYQRRQPAIALRGLGDRLRHIATSRPYFSLGFVAWITFGVYWYVTRYLGLFYLIVGMPINGHGFDFNLPNYQITAGDLAALQSGVILVDDNGRTVIDPNLDYVLVINVERTTREQIESELEGICFEAGSFWPRERFILIEYGAGTTYHEMVEVLDPIYGLERTHGCKRPWIRFVRGP
jgi:hypothetical protein